MSDCVHEIHFLPKVVVRPPTVMSDCVHEIHFLPKVVVRFLLQVLTYSNVDKYSEDTLKRTFPFSILTLILLLHCN